MDRERGTETRGQAGPGQEKKKWPELSTGGLDPDDAAAANAWWYAASAAAARSSSADSG